MLKYLSVLEQSVAIDGCSQAQSIQDAIELAKLCETLGFHRFWVSEHHSHPSIVGSAPEILMAAISSVTQSIRLGSAGVMLPHYSALKVAEQFRVLEALAPGRIDLGVGRAPGSDLKTAQLLNPDSHSSERFPEQIRDLSLWLKDEIFPDGHPGKGVHAYPQSETSPDLWVLGSSDYGAQVAAHFGLPYAFAHFITDGRNSKAAIDIYKSNFVPSEHLPKPQALVCVWALAAETEEEAWRQFASRFKWRSDRNQGKLGPLVSPELALSTLSQMERAQFDLMRSNALVGNPEQVMSKLNALAEELEIEEISVITWAHDFYVRQSSYRLLAEAAGLNGRN